MNNNSFTFIPAPWIPFQDKKVLEQVRDKKRGYGKTLKSGF